MGKSVKNNRLKILNGQFSIYRLSIESLIPPQIYESEFYSIVKTDDEISIVCESSIHLTAEKSSHGWTCYKICRAFGFFTYRYFIRNSRVLADSKISIFAVSTYNTDYILIEAADITDAEQALIAAGYTFED